MMSRRRLALYSLALLTAIICLLLLTDRLPALRGPVWLDGAWRWPYALRPLARWWFPITAALAMLGAVTWWLKGSGTGKGRTAVGLLALVAASLFLQASLVYADRPAVAAEVVDRNLAPQTSGYFRTAAEIVELGPVLRDYPTVMIQFESEHARTHPPGLILFNWFLIQAFERVPSLASTLAGAARPLRCSDLWLLEGPDARLAGLVLSSLFFPLAAAAAIPVAYATARQLTERKGARLATVLVATLPALILFIPLADQLLAFLGLLVILLLLLAAKLRSMVLYFAAGVALSVASLISLGVLSLAIVAAVLMASQAWTAAPGRLAVYKWAGAFALGLASLWLMYWLVWGIAPWELASTAMGQHFDLVTSQRRYGIWLGFNALDLVLFAGPVIFFGFIGAVIAATGHVRTKTLKGVDSLSLGLASMIVILFLSGVTRGEVGRIWLFFMPLLAIAAGTYVDRCYANWRVALALTGFQLALLVSLGLAWRPIEAIIVRAERPVMAPVPANAVDLNVSFSDGTTLAGYSAPSEEARPGETMSVVLLWSGNGPASRPYTVFAHLVDDEGALVAQSDAWPARGQWPPTCWQASEEVVDPIEIELPAKIAPGEYRLLIGLYDAKSAQRLLMTDGSDTYQLMSVHVAQYE